MMHVCILQMMTLRSSRALHVVALGREYPLRDGTDYLRIDVVVMPIVLEHDAAATPPFEAARLRGCGCG